MLPPRLTCKLPLLAALVLLPLTAAHAAAATYRYDTVHSQILFSIDHNGYSRPFGRLHIASGWLRLDTDDWSSAATELDIDLASLDMGDAAWNSAVGKPDFLDSGRARYAHFTSTSAERKDDQHGVLHGQLTLRGVTRPLSLPFTLNRVAKTIYGLHTVAGFSATATLDRTDFGITANAGSIGRSVSVWLELEAIRDDAAQTDPIKTDPSKKEQP
ncbi:YceI family protein [Dyella tabacisoli]|uniref:YceI family protein n=1 Tax=Dyella tabacisoli TaxID=2282381 RepID=A0A369UJ17_9GAMM|nr:YceI family protein [Dyella tabacisoli]RDD80536.1 YceI family protein [Dyella tabacisoli]